MSGRRRPDYPLVLTTGLAIHRGVSVAAKLYAAAAAAVLRHDPGVRILEALLPFGDATLSRAARDLERLGLVQVARRPGLRLRVEPTGLAAPGSTGRNRYATIPAALVQGTLDAVGGRHAATALLVVQRLLRDQRRRGAVQVPVAVIAADLAIKPVLAMKLLADLEAGGLIERRPTHPDDADELPVLTVPLAGDTCPVEPGRLDADQTRLIERIDVGGQDLCVLGPRSDLARLAILLPELRVETPPNLLAVTIGALVEENLTRDTFLAEDLLPALKRHLRACANDTYARAQTTPEGRSDDTSKDLDLDLDEKRYAHGLENRAPNLDAGRAGPREKPSSDEEARQSSAASTTRPGTHTYQAPYHPSVSYTARPETHERIAALLDVVARRYGDGEAGGAAYLAVEAATEEWKRGATGSAVLEALSRRFGYLAESAEPPAIELDFGRIGEPAA